MTKDELIAALESATGPSRKLDAEIACLGDATRRISRKRLGCYVEDGFTRAALEYTRLIDAALTLFRDKQGFSLTVEYDEEGVYLGATVVTPRRWGYTKPVKHSAPAIALCIAAMKARNHG